MSSSASARRFQRDLDLSDDAPASGVTSSSPWEEDLGPASSAGAYRRVMHAALRPVAGEGPSLDAATLRAPATPRDIGRSLPGDVRQSLPGDVRQSLPSDVERSLPRDVGSSYVRLRDLLETERPEAPPSSAPLSVPVPAVAPVSASRRIVAALLSAGVDTFFGVPGGPISPLFEAVLGTEGARMVESRHESHAAFQAMGYHRATGKVAAVLVTAGPGATNTMTGVTAAFTERVPMLVVCGDVAWAATGGRMAQDSGPEGIAVERMFSRVTRATVRASRAESASTQALAALNAATDPLQPGPALFVLPMDIARGSAPDTPPPSTRRTAVVPAPPASVVKAAEWLAGAERPVVVIGHGARPHAAMLRRVLDVLNVPFFTTPQAKGIVSEDHPHSLRHGGLAASWWARRYTAQGPDVALVLGTDLDDSSVGPTKPVADRIGTKLIHVDLDATVFHRNFRADLPIVADLGTFLAQLYDAVTIDGVRNPKGCALAREVRSTSPFDTAEFASDEAEIIAPHRAIADLERAAGPGARFVSDIGEHMLFALHYLTAKSPEAFTIHLGLGSMASGIASAIGQALADRGRRVVCICGDGGMQMAGMELLVAAREKLPIVYAVFNDARYNMVYHGMKQLYGTPAAWETPWVDFTMWAGSFGVAAARIERPGEITPELLDLLTANGPCVLDIRIDRDVRIKGAGRVESLHHMSVRPPAA